MLHSGLDMIVREAVCEGFIVSISTNAIDVDSQRAKRLYDNGLRKATVSLDGFDRVTSAFLRRNQEAHDLTLRGINNLVKNGIAVTVNVVLSPSIAGHLSDVVLAVQPLGVRLVSFTFPVCRGARVPIQWEQQVGNHQDTYIQEVIELDTSPASECQFLLHIPRCDQHSCPAGKQILGINEYGEEVACLVKQWVASPSDSLTLV